MKKWKNNNQQIKNKVKSYNLYLLIIKLKNLF